MAAQYCRDTPDTPDDGLRPKTCRVNINKKLSNIKESVHFVGENDHLITDHLVFLIDIFSLEKYI
jgi:hypothetical protein